ncbi:polysaccharide biosynthesis/export family protein [Nostocaceae cyanobacterium CENA357]|uniref:Polysaccharide biosynthesis/export family protein n=1 Tax=Atlanticothrix silvestris CENA357 TaxID=1725252 RepID=A0A8J7HD37_9CYAN|nr:polysaccharide biosynthesis/export family protein [Atlanticothrix silvestris]MBH8550855.1 polysaccharide biosynthesis/export family protein [Atlanticothrix silvestris CENA357]
MFIVSSYQMRAFSALCFVSFQASVFLTTTARPVDAQSSPSPGTQPGQPLLFPPGAAQRQLPSPPLSTEVAPVGVNDEASSQLNRYLLGPGDVIGVVFQRPPGPYRLGPGDAISVVVQRFPDLSFQAPINPEGNIIVPLLGTVSLQGLTLPEAQEKIRLLLNRYVIDPVIVLSLIGQRPDLSFQAQISPEGNIVVPQVGTLSLQGLSLEEAQEKIRLSLSQVVVDPMLVVSLVSPRPVQITVTGEVFRPGIYGVASPIPRITDALLTAGGSTMSADLRQVQVRRKLMDGSTISQNIDLYATLQNGGSLPSLRLQDGDAIVVPKREVGTDDSYDRNLVARSSLAVPQIRVRVLNYAGGGLVTQALPNGSTFVDALGGINLDAANLRDIALVRFDAERGRAVTQKLDAKKALSGDAAQNVALQDNDVIVVGRNLIARITNVLGTITRPFFDIRSFIRFFDFLGGGSN